MVVIKSLHSSPLLASPLLSSFFCLLLSCLVPPPSLASYSSLHPQVSINNSGTQVTERASRKGALLTRGRVTWLVCWHPGSNQLTERRSYSDDWQEADGAFKPGVMLFTATRGRCGLFVDTGLCRRHTASGAISWSRICGRRHQPSLSGLCKF